MTTEKGCYEDESPWTVLLGFICYHTVRPLGDASPDLCVPILDDIQAVDNHNSSLHCIVHGTYTVYNPKKRPGTAHTGTHRHVTRSRVHERTISLKFLGIILRVLRLEVYLTGQFQTTFARGGGGGGVKSFSRVTVRSKKENSLDFCPNYVQEIGLWNRIILLLESRDPTCPSACVSWERGEVIARGDAHCTAPLPPCAAQLSQIRWAPASPQTLQ